MDAASVGLEVHPWNGWDVRRERRAPWSLERDIVTEERRDDRTKSREIEGWKKNQRCKGFHLDFIRNERWCSPNCKKMRCVKSNKKTKTECKTFASLLIWIFIVVIIITGNTTHHTLRHFPISWKIVYFKFDGSNHLKKDGRGATKDWKVISTNKKQLCGESLVYFCIYHNSNSSDSFSPSDIFVMLFSK